MAIRSLQQGLFLRGLVRLAISLPLLLLVTESIFADGGRLRIAQTSGPYRITVFTSPDPLQTELCDVSVLVQQADSSALASEVSVSIEVRPASDPAAVPRRFTATTAAATNQLFRAAKFTLPRPDIWTITVLVSGPQGEGRIDFNAEVLAPQSTWNAGWTAIAVGAGLLLIVALRMRMKWRR